MNILKYVYLNENIEEWKKLRRKVVSGKCNKGDKFDYLYFKYYGFLRELGFSRSEIFDIVEELNYSEPIGDAFVRLYCKKREFDTRINTNKNNYIFFKKLEVIVSFYLKSKCSSLEDLDTSIGLNDINLRMSNVEYDIIDGKYEIIKRR